MVKMSDNFLSGFDMDQQKQTNLKETGRLMLVWLPVVLFFMSYPLSLFVPVRLGIPFTAQLALPSFFWLSLLAVVYLLVIPLRRVSGRAWLRGKVSPEKLIRAVLAVVLALCLASAWWGRTAEPTALVGALGWFCISIFVAVCPRRLLPRRLILVLGLLWLAPFGKTPPELNQSLGI
jgi:hypothetical protein